MHEDSIWSPRLAAQSLWPWSDGERTTLAGAIGIDGQVLSNGEEMWVRSRKADVSLVGVLFDHEKWCPNPHRTGPRSISHVSDASEGTSGHAGPGPHPAIRRLSKPGDSWSPLARLNARSQAKPSKRLEATLEVLAGIAHAHGWRLPTALLVGHLSW